MPAKHSISFFVPFLKTVNLISYARDMCRNLEQLPLAGGGEMFLMAIRMSAGGVGRETASRIKRRDRRTARKERGKEGFVQG